MKKWILGFLAVVMASPLTMVNAQSDKPDTPILSADAAILYNLSTDEVLYEKNIEEPIPTGSLTKIMTMLLASEALKKGDLSLEDEVEISEKAWRLVGRGSSMFLEVGRTATVEELMQGVSIASGNDAAVALAEALDKDVDTFVERMNKRAKELGMTKTVFHSPNGLVTDLSETSTAKDLLVLTKAYWEKFPKNMEMYHAKQDMTYETRPGKEVKLVNQNSLLSSYSGTIGLKTGWIGSHYNIAATVDRDGMKMIAIVLSSTSPGQRTTDTIRLLQFGANQYKAVTPFKKGSEYRKVAVYKSDRVEQSPILFKENLTFVVRKEVDPDTLRYDYDGKGYVTGGTKEGDVLGVYRVFQGDKELASTEVVASETLKKGSGIGMFFDSVAIFFTHTLIDWISSLF